MLSLHVSDDMIDYPNIDACVSGLLQYRLVVKLFLPKETLTIQIINLFNKN